MLGYQLIISLDISFCLWLAYSRAAKMSFPQKQILDLSLILMLSSFIGARAMHVLYEYPNLYLSDPWRIFAFWRGGFVFYGGALLAGLSGYLTLKHWQVSDKARYFDFFAPLISLAHAIGRLGCLYAGCCYGKSCDLPWGILAQDDYGIFKLRHPTQIYMAAWEFATFFILMAFEKKRPRFLNKPGQLFIFWLITHSIGRLIIESYREDFRGPEFGLSVSSWISIGLAAAGLVFYIRQNYQQRIRK